MIEIKNEMIAIQKDGTILGFESKDELDNWKEKEGNMETLSCFFIGGKAMLDYINSQN